tara:strand:+ start:7231 stop:8151 length:921 start_codon:yes stop_codon:yes gene_type:complete
MKIDLEIGDTILTGRFKNKPVEVKNIGTDDKGQPTINGRPALKFRIKKLMSKQEEQIRGIVREEIINYLKGKSITEGVIWKNLKKYPIQKPPRNFAKKSKMGAMVHFTGHKSGAKGETWSKAFQDEWMAIFGDGVKGDMISSTELDKRLAHQGRVQIKEGKLKESGILYKAGVKKYGKEGMKKIQSAAGKGENHEEIGKIKDKYEKGKNETVDEKKKLLNDKLSKSQMAFMQKQLKPNRGDIITYDRFFKFGKVARDEKAKVVAVNGYNVQLDNGNTLDLRSFPIKKVNNKVYDRDLSMYDDILMR